VAAVSSRERVLIAAKSVGVVPLRDLSVDAKLLGAVTPCSICWLAE
jgi:hypothetical protein